MAISQTCNFTFLKFKRDNLQHYNFNWKSNQSLKINWYWMSFPSKETSFGPNRFCIRRLDILMVFVCLYFFPAKKWQWSCLRRDCQFIYFIAFFFRTFVIQFGEWNNNEKTHHIQTKEKQQKRVSVVWPIWKSAIQSSCAMVSFATLFAFTVNTND